MIDQQLTAHFWLSEFLHSDIAVRFRIDNTPTAYALANIETSLAQGMQRARNLLGYPIILSSGYRCEELNIKVKGAKDSAHVQGLAADFTCPALGPPRKIATNLMIHAQEIGYDQLIYEGTWVHLAFARAGSKPRREALTAVFGPRKVFYTAGIT